MSLSKETRAHLRERYGHDIKFIEKDETFKYACSCCGNCCKNRHNSDPIILNPTDVYNLAKGLNISIPEFISKHTDQILGKSSGLVLLVLKDIPTFNPMPFAQKIPTGTKCTFLTFKEGQYVCGVDDFKPSVCRIYPLGRVSSSEDGENKFTYFLQNVGCQTKDSIPFQKEYSIEQWIPNLKENERAFNEQHNLLKEIGDIINLRAVFDSNRIENHFKELLYSSMIKSWYGGFDLDIDFFEQLDSVKDNYFIFLKNLVSVLQEKDSRVIGEEFKEFYEKTDALMYIVSLLMLN